MTSKLSLTSSRAVIAVALIVGGLAGCSRAGQNTASGTTDANTLADTAPPLSALPLTTADPGPVAPAPAGSALPPAPRARLARLARPEQQYAYLDRAYAAGQAYADAPPDYTFDYSGTRPWVWRSDDGGERVAERLPQGWRYYYYQPGADEPYLVQDPDYAYGYSDGELVSVYQNGALLPYDAAAERADMAGRYLARAAALYAASLHQERLAVAQARWQAERTDIAANQAQWAQEQSQQAAWQTFHDAHQQEYQAHFAQEQYRRNVEAARFAQSVDDQAGAARALQAAAQAQALAHLYNRGGGAPPQGGFQPQSPSGSSRVPPYGQPGQGGLQPVAGRPFAPQPVGAAQPDVRQARQEAEAQILAQQQAAQHASAAAQADAAAQAARQAVQQAATRQAQAAAQANAQREAARQTQAHAQQAQREALAQQAVAQRAQAEAAAQVNRRAAQAEQAGARQAQAAAQTQANAQREAARQAQAEAHAQQAVQVRAAQEARSQQAVAERAQAEAASRAQQQAARQGEAAASHAEEKQAQAAQNAAHRPSTPPGQPIKPPSAPEKSKHDSEKKPAA